jgi:hypothetical protein
MGMYILSKFIYAAETFCILALETSINKRQKQVQIEIVLLR